MKDLEFVAFKRLLGFNDNKMTPSDLYAWRKDLGLKQYQAAEILGMSVTSYGCFERGYADKRRGVVSIPLKIKMACRGIKASYHLGALKKMDSGMK